MKLSFTKKQAALIVEVCLARFVALENEASLTKAQQKEHKMLDALLHEGALTPLAAFV